MLLLIGIGAAAGIALAIVFAALRIVLSIFLSRETMARYDASMSALASFAGKLFVVCLAVAILAFVYLVVQGAMQAK